MPDKFDQRPGKGIFIYGPDPDDVTSTNKAQVDSQGRLKILSGSSDAATETTLAAINTKVGEVQATPTANTILARLKDLLTGIVLATGTNVIGAVTQSGNWIIASITNALPAGTNVIGKVGIDQTTPGTTNRVDIGVALPTGTNAIGKLAANSGVDIGDVDVTSISHGKTIKTVTGTISATITIVNAVASKRLKVFAMSLIMNSTTVVTATFKDGAGGAALWTTPLQAGSGMITGSNLAVAVPSFLFATSASNLLELSLSAAVSVTYNISYFDDDGT